jgi:hypothetical protein
MHAFGMVEYGLPVLLVGGVVVIALATLLLHLLFPAAKRPARGMVLSKIAKLCPVCRRRLAKADRHGLRIEVCPDCQGVWLTQDELEQLIG